MHSKHVAKMLQVMWLGSWMVSVTKALQRRQAGLSVDAATLQGVKE